nr:MAG TPA: hypothetical protein [Caudoviricetes sp.]
MQKEVDKILTYLIIKAKIIKRDKLRGFLPKIKTGLNY